MARARSGAAVAQHDTMIRLEESMTRGLLLIAFALLPAATSARTYQVLPANPTAMEFVELRSDLGGECERLRNVEPVAGGFRVNITLLSLGLRCDEILPGALDFTLGAFAPGTYRVTTRINCIDCSPPTFDEPTFTTFTVSPGVASPVAGDDYTQVDLSGIWTTPSQAFTGFAFVHSDGLGANGRTARVTGLWYDYGSAGQPTWSLLLLDGTPFRLAGQVVRAVPTGTGANRTIALTTIGSATLALDAAGSYRLQGSVDQRGFDLTLERFRWTRSAWPSRAPDPQ